MIFFQIHPFAIDHFASSTKPCQFGANAKQGAIDHSFILLNIKKIHTWFTIYNMVL